eukprot:m.225842 g.225842  ORF g.225842 m.225842 type:complete len:92 (-) comp22354_c4_seq1:52-327(-)
MHLCGLLSSEAVALFQRVPNMRGLVLSPCCLPRKTVSPIVDEANERGVNQYDHWCQHLHSTLPSLNTNTIQRDEHIKSERNYVLTSFRPAL